MDLKVFFLVLKENCFFCAISLLFMNLPFEISINGEKGVNVKPIRTLMDLQTNIMEGFSL